MGAKQFLSDVKMDRRTFVKATAAVGAAALLEGYAGSRKFYPNELFAPVEAASGGNVTKTKSICSFCAIGCGYVGVAEDGVFTRMEPWEDHPINQGGMCSKGASLVNTTNNPRRLRYPMEKSGGKWKRISWDEALDKIANKLNSDYDKYGADATFFCGLVHGSNEECFMFRKLAMLYGTNNIDHQARICHSTTVAGLLATFGHGADTNATCMVSQAKCHFFFGSNACEAHPTYMQKVFESRDRNGARIVVADPRFTRTASFADFYARFRPGSDIALLNSIMYVIIYELDAVATDYVDNRTYGYEYVKEVVKNYPPEVAEDITWVKAEDIRTIANMISANRPSNITWSMGATQHSVGSQIIRASAILQCILGNQGEWGGGCIPIRGHDNVQGATDMCILAHFTPGYYTVKSEASFEWWAKCFSDTPSTSGKITFEELKSRFGTLSADSDSPKAGVENGMMTLPGFTISNWYGGVLLPPVTGIDQNTNIKNALFWGEAITSVTELKKSKEALEKLEMLVVVDPFPGCVTALPDRSDGIIVLPAATRQEGGGSVTTTGRAWQWRDPIVSPLYESKTDFWIFQQLANRLGFGEHFDYKSYEDVTREINLGSRAIGNQGETPERLKKQKENSKYFNPLTGLAEGGPCDGEWWGLPWPCWTETHPGTPVLYSDKLPVSKGGHDFRAKWKYPDGPNKGKEIVRGNLPPATTGGSIHWTYGYAKDASGEVNKQAIAEGNPPTGRGRALLRAWSLADPVPIHREPVESPRPDLVEKYPTYADQPHQYRWCVCEFATEQQRSVSERRHEKYPIVLTSGRQVEHHGGGAQTRNNDILVEIQPEMYVEINPTLAANKGISQGDWVWVESARGKIKVKAKVTNRVNDKTAFCPFHWGGVLEGKDYGDRFPPGTAELARGDSVNIIASPGVDQVTQMQETKVALCNIYKA